MDQSFKRPVVTSPVLVQGPLGPVLVLVLPKKVKRLDWTRPLNPTWALFHFLPYCHHLPIIPVHPSCFPFTLYEHLLVVAVGCCGGHGYGGMVLLFLSSHHYHCSLFHPCPYHRCVISHLLSPWPSHHPHCSLFPPYKQLLMVAVGVAAVVVVSTPHNHPVSRGSQWQPGVGSTLVRHGHIVFASLCCYNTPKTHELLKHMLVETKTKTKQTEKKNISGARWQ